MNTRTNRKTSIAAAVGAAVTAAAAPVLLFLGAGTAQAQPYEIISYDGDLLGVGLTVHVADTTGKSGECYYTANPLPGQLTSPFLQTYVHNFYLPAFQQVSWTVSSSELGTPALATGTKWYVNVSCPGVGGASLDKTF
jgi:hypothetical protein